MCSFYHSTLVLREKCRCLRVNLPFGVGRRGLTCSLLFALLLVCSASSTIWLLSELDQRQAGLHIDTICTSTQGSVKYCPSAEALIYAQESLGL